MSMINQQMTGGTVGNTDFLTALKNAVIAINGLNQQIGLLTAEMGTINTTLSNGNAQIVAQLENIVTAIGTIP